MGKKAYLMILTMTHENDMANKGKAKHAQRQHIHS